MASTQIKLTDRPGPKVEIAEAVFGTRLQIDQLREYQPYFSYYTSEIELLHAGIAQESRQIAALATKSYEDILFVVGILRANSNLTRPQIRDILLQRFDSASEVELNRSINLAIRLWLMINTQDTEFETLRAEATCVLWDDHISLSAFADGLFPKAVWPLNMATSRLGPYFTAAFMHRVCGLSIEWTTSLHDHLRLDRRRNSLRVFPFKCHIAGLLTQHHSGTFPPIPRQALLETLQSLEVLFPIWDADTIALVQREDKAFLLEAPFSSRPVTLLGFDHWRDRLLELQEVLHCPPVSWAQLWRDRRNPQQFWTFWIALVILILTVVSSITGVVQAVISILVWKYPPQTLE